MAITSDIDYTRIVNPDKSATNGERSSKSNLDKPTNDNSFITNYKYDDNFNKFISQIEIKLLRAIELYDLIHDDNNSEIKKEMQRNHIDELLSCANFLQTLLNFLILYLSRSLQPLNLEIMRLIPSVNRLIFISSRFI